MFPDLLSFFQQKGTQCLGKWKSTAMGLVINLTGTFSLSYLWFEQSLSRAQGKKSKQSGTTLLSRCWGSFWGKLCETKQWTSLSFVSLFNFAKLLAATFATRLVSRKLGWFESFSANAISVSDQVCHLLCLVCRSSRQEMSPWNNTQNNHGLDTARFESIVKSFPRRKFGVNNSRWERAATLKGEYGSHWFYTKTCKLNFRFSHR